MQPAPAPIRAQRSFPPGSEWLYAKVYCGSSTADVLLREAISPLVRQAMEAGEAKRWFFIRYGDPEWHLRLRFQGDPALLAGKVLPRLYAALESHHGQGKLWRMQLDTNLTGVFHCCRAVLPYLKRRGGGWIVNISSLAGKNPFPDAAAYCASKAGLNAFSESLMQEVRHDGIRVSYVMPGSVATDFTRGGSSGADWKLTSADVAQVVMDLLAHPDRSLPSRVELRPSQPPKK